jgi:hypothetical protein
MIIGQPRKMGLEGTMDLANMRQNGVRSLEVACLGCRHQVVINVDQYPGDLLVKEFGPRMVCTKCGIVGADGFPIRGARPSGERSRSFAPGSHPTRRGNGWPVVSLR